MTYLDNAATTYPKPEAVYKAMDEVNRNAVNAGRGAYKKAHEMSHIISDTKNKIRKLVKADINIPVVFSPSITIALNQIINGLDMKSGETIYVSPYEHNAVARTVEHVATKLNIKVIELPLNEKLEIDIEKMKYLFSKNRPNYLFCTHVSNVTGYILPVKEIFAEAKKYNSITVLDSAQSMGLIAIDCRTIGADIIAFAGHKTLYGPLGIGGFINISNIKLGVFITGGTGSDSLNLGMPDSAEGRYEAASSNILAIKGLNVALDNLDQELILNKERELTEKLIQELQSIKNVRVISPYDKENRVGIVSIILENYNSDDVGMILDEDYDIAVRTGYHCAPYIHKFMNDLDKLGTVRISLGRYNTVEDIEKIISAIKEIV